MSPRLLGVFRALLATAVACVAAYVLFVAAGDQLHRPIDIVGYPTSHDFDFHRIFLGYRLVVWFIPAVALLVDFVAGRWGPLARPARPAAGEVPGPDPVVPGDVVPVPTPFFRALRLLPGGLLVAGVVGSGPSASGYPRVGVVSLLAGVGWVLVVVLLAVAAGRVLGRPLGPTLACVNATGGMVVAVLCLHHVAATTGVFDERGRVQHWPWLPWWAAGLLLLAGLGYLARQARRGRSADWLEWRTVTVVLGSVLMAVSCSHLRGAVDGLVGFDDSQSVVGADLITRGYFPWRDFTFIHGVFEDALRSLVGFAAFGHTVWGADAASRMFWVPVAVVGDYLLLVWATPTRWLTRIGLAFLLVSLAHLGDLVYRLCFVGFAFFLLGRALETRRTGWYIALTVMLFAQAVLVPETSFLVVAVAVVVVLRDLVALKGGPRSVRRVLASSRATVICAVTGVSCLVLWCGFLIAHGALGAFVDYYRLVGPGHDAAGTLPLDMVTHALGHVTFGIVVLAVVVGLVTAGIRVRRGTRFATRHWVMLAATLYSAMYGEKALGRFDLGHIYQVLTATVPLLLLLLVDLVEYLDLRWGARWETVTAEGEGRPLTAGPGSVLVCAVVVLVFGPLVGDDLRYVPGNNTAIVPSITDVPDHIGYAVPGTIRTGYVRQLKETASLLAGPDGGVFDFTNSPGYVYFLAQQRLVARYFQVSVAIPEYAQRGLVGELRTARPAVVIFDARTMGLPSWDGLRSEVRHFIVSQYILDHWRPVASLDGTLFLLRDDLRPHVGRLRREVGGDLRTRHLYASAPRCRWGYSAGFLTSRPTGATRVLRVVTTSSSHGVRRAVVRVPRGVRLADYSLARFSTSDGPIGRSWTWLRADAPTGGRDGTVSFRTLPAWGDSVAVRVGSCLPWRGFEGRRRLYLSQVGGRPITRIVLSGVSDR